MAVGDPELQGDGGGTGLAAAAVSCSVCLEFVVDSGERSTARLRCGHLFHLDCIGSAFNAKGVMECPNCRKVEKGNWLYSNGHRWIPEFLDEWMHEDDSYGITYSEVPFGVHFCPFSRLARFPFSYEEGEYTTSLGYSDLLGRRAISSEYPGSQVSNESAATNGPNFHHSWNSIPVPVDVPNSHAFPVLDVHHQTWDSHTRPTNHVSGVEQALASTTRHVHHQTWDSHTQPTNHVSGVEQASASTTRHVHHQTWDSHTQPSNRVNGVEQASASTTRAVRIGSDTHPRQMYIPLTVGRGSGSGANNLTIPHHVGNSRGQSHHEGHGAHPRVRGVANYFPNAGRFGSSRSLASRGPAPQAEQRSVYFIHPVAPSTRNPQDTEPSGSGSNLSVQESDRLAAFPLSPVNRNFPWWSPLPQTNTSQDSSGWTGLWPRHSSERPPSQPPPRHHPRLHPFI